MLSKEAPLSFGISNNAEIVFSKIYSILAPQESAQRFFSADMSELATNDLSVSFV